MCFIYIMFGISFIIPVYNTEINLIQECLKSIFLSNVENYEIIIVDDGSKENVLLYLDKLSTNEHLKIIKSSHNGVSSARNLGINHALYEYIIFVDSDDLLDSSCVFDCITLMHENKLDILGFGLTKVFNEYRCNNISELNDFYMFSPDEKKLLYENILDITNAKEYPYCGLVREVAGKIYNVEFLRSHELFFDNSLKYGEDLIFILKAMQATSKIACISNKLYFYRTRPNSALKSFDFNKTKNILKTVKSIYCLKANIDCIPLSFNWCIYGLVRDILLDIFVYHEKFLSDNDIQLFWNQVTNDGIVQEALTELSKSKLRLKNRVFISAIIYKNMNLFKTILFFYRLVNGG